MPDAIERAGTTETEAVIEALENTNLETALHKNFAYTSNHDILVKPDEVLVILFQWQANGTRVPVYPREVKEELGITYTYPDWPGPWD